MRDEQKNRYLTTDVISLGWNPRLGDTSMLEHQHLNMFTERAIRLILAKAGFTRVNIRGGSYGNTFHVIAVKGGGTDSNESPLKNHQAIDYIG